MTEDELLRADFYSWMLARYHLPNKERYTFEGYEYLAEIAKRRWNPKTAKRVGDHVFVRKSSQCGASEFAIGLLLWMNDRKLKNWKGSGLVFPATQQLHDHLKARLFPIMEIPYFNAKLKNANLRYFRWNDNPIYFRGGQTRRDLIGWPGDFIILDEFDEFADPITIIPTIEARQNASDYQWILGLSTPTYPDIGIDRAYSMSNQFNWYVKCSKCSKSFSPLVEIQTSGFDSCVVQAPISKDVGFVCPNCHELTQTNGASGEWVLDVKADNNNFGYSISRLFVKNSSLGQLLTKYEDALNVQEFYNSELGLPYAPANAKLTRADIVAASTGMAELAFGSIDSTWMGVDVGLKCHWVIGKTRENGQVEIIAYGINDWDHLREIESRYNVKNAVIDLRPYEQEVKRHISGKRGYFACDFNVGNQEDWYKFTTADDETRGVHTRVIKADRTQSCDHLISQMSIKKKLILPACAKGDNRFVNQLCAPTRMALPDPKTGDIRAVYNRGGKADHFYFAFVYLLLALETKRTSVAVLGPRIY